jgi:outer membrane protein assembly factor BamD
MVRLFCKHILSVASVIGLVACSTTPQNEPYIEKSVEVLYNEGMDLLESGSPAKAAVTFAEVERQHPYSNWAVKAQLMSAYSYYLAKKYDESIETYRVFIQLHPSHERIAYAYYMLGLCYYEQIPTVERDQNVTEESLKAFEEVVRRFPTSPYAKDAGIKIEFIRDHLAGKEMEVGRYYQSHGAYLSAVNRFKNIIQGYQTTSHVPEALHRLVECYLALGIMDQAQASAAVLGHNYPSSSWYADSYALIKAANPSAVLEDKQQPKSSQPTQKPSSVPSEEAPVTDPRKLGEIK